jgi:hypothetical protein
MSAKDFFQSIHKNTAYPSFYAFLSKIAMLSAFNLKFYQ